MNEKILQESVISDGFFHSCKGGQFLTFSFMIQYMKEVSIQCVINLIKIELYVEMALF